MADQLFGVYRGNVVNNKDPLNQRRVRLRVPQVLGDAVTDWAWPVDSNSTHFTAPAVGQGVLVMFEGGDPSWPIWIGTFGKEASSDYQLYIKKLKSTEDISDVTDLLVTSKTPSGDKQVDITQSLLNLSRNHFYGSFYSTQTQSTQGVMTFNVTDFSSGVSIVSNSRITVKWPGVYNLAFSAQLDKTDSGTDTVEIWLSKNGSNVDWSSTMVDVTNNNGKVVAAWNFFFKTTVPNEYVELHWYSADTSMRIYAQSPTNGRPAVPSVIATVNKVR